MLQAVTPGSRGSFSDRNLLLNQYLEITLERATRNPRNLGQSLTRGLRLLEESETGSCGGKLRAQIKQ